MSLDTNKTYLVWNGAEFPNSTSAFFKAPAGSTIDWGDGTVETFSTASTAKNTHTYTDGKTEHTITISGLTNIGNSAFYNCSSLTSVTIGNSVTSIVVSAFYNCSNLKSVTIGNSVTSIDNTAFRRCTKLTQLILFPSTPPTLSSNAIPDNVQSIYVPQSSKAAYQAATNWKTFASKIVGDNIYLSFVRFNQKNKEYISKKVDEKVDELSAAANLENGTGAGSLVQKTVSSSGVPYANEASGSGAVAMGKKVKSKGNATFVTGQENEALAGTSGSFTSGRLNVNRGSYNITGGENNANNNSWNLVIGKGNAVSDGRFGIVSGLDNVFTGLGSDENSAVSMLGKNLYVQYSMPSDGALLIGRYNRVQNNPGRLFIVGNGTSPDDRKNAFEVLEDGRAKIQTTPQDTNDVTNKGYVDGIINALTGSGIQGTGNPPLQGYNKGRGTIETRLLAAESTTSRLNSCYKSGFGPNNPYSNSIKIPINSTETNALFFVMIAILDRSSNKWLNCCMTIGEGKPATGYFVTKGPYSTDLGTVSCTYSNYEYTLTGPSETVSTGSFAYNLIRAAVLRIS